MLEPETLEVNSIVVTLIPEMSPDAALAAKTHLLAPLLTRQPIRREIASSDAGALGQHLLLEAEKTGRTDGVEADAVGERSIVICKNVGCALP